MAFMTLIGLVAATIIGFVLGLLGGGGSILTVPVLVYVMNIEPVLATAYSLFVVGSSSLVGVVRYWQKKLLDIKSSLVFALPSLVSVYCTRKYIIPALPDELWRLNDFVLYKNTLIMIVFAVLMLLASVSMIKGRKSTMNKDVGIRFDYLKIVLSGVLVGFLAGFVGAGGGFLIIPALVAVIRLPMKLAVGTSLMIISINSLIGFLGDIGHAVIDWGFLLPFTAFAICGILIGTYVSRFVDNLYLKKLFGWFVVIVAMCIIILEFA